MFTGLVGPRGRVAPGFRFHSPVGPIARACSGLSACWAGHCQLQPCQALNRDLRPLGAVIVALPAVPIDAATVGDPAASVVVALEAEVVGAMVAVIADRLRPVQPVPSVGPLVIVHSVIGHLVIVPSLIAPFRIDPLGTERARRVTVVLLSSPATVRHGRMPAGHSPVQPVPNAVPNHPARTSFGGLGLHSLAQ
jgi:hypothetical protein